MDKSDFLANISHRLGRPTPLTTAPNRTIVGAPDFWKDYQLTLDDRIVHFQKELANVGGHGIICSSLYELKDGLADVLHTLKPGRIGTWGGDSLAEFNIEEVLEPYHRESWGRDALERFEQVEVGITGCAYAIADTGTLVMKSDHQRGRSVSVLPAVHIALLRDVQIYSRLGEVLEKLADERDHMTSGVHFITGPSRSSDIENDQTIGIHGPAAVYAFILSQ